MKMFKDREDIQITTLADRPMTYFDISIDGEEVGRIIFELFTDVTPKTCENFLRICQNQSQFQFAANSYQQHFQRICPKKF